MVGTPAYGLESTLVAKFNSYTPTTGGSFQVYMETRVSGN